MIESSARPKSASGNWMSAGRWSNLRSATIRWALFKMSSRDCCVVERDDDLKFRLAAEASLAGKKQNFHFRSVTARRRARGQTRLPPQRRHFIRLRGLAGDANLQIGRRSARQPVAAASQPRRAEEIADVGAVAPSHGRR